MRKFNRLHCDSTVRARFTDSWGRVIALTGTHAFEYTIHRRHQNSYRNICEWKISKKKI